MSDQANYYQNHYIAPVTIENGKQKNKRQPASSATLTKTVTAQISLKNIVSFNRLVMSFYSRSHKGREDHAYQGKKPT